MRTTITLELRAEDAEPILREAADEAARFSAWCDYITPKTYNAPNASYYQPRGGLAAAKREWQAKFLRAKRIVESFGVEYEQTSESETMTITHPLVGGKRKIVDLGSELGKVGMITGSKPDLKNPQPSYRGGTHAEACKAAAERTVRKWRALVEAEAAA